MTDFNPPRETWTAEQCADHWGIKPSTWRAYVSTRPTVTPQPLRGFDEDRRRRWDAAEVRAWSRPGRGARTDLSKPVDPA